MRRKISIKKLLLGLAVLVIAMVALISPEHTESVAKAFMLLLGASW